MLPILFLVLSALIFAEGAYQEINPNILNKDVERAIDITSQLVKFTATITLENTGKDAVNGFLVALEPGLGGNLSHIAAKDLPPLTEVQVKSRDDETFYYCKLNSPLASGRTTVVVLEEVFSKILVPFPSSITQKERQLVRYFGNHYYYSPYVTKKQTTLVTLPSKNIESYTKLKPVSQQAATLTYGPYTDVAPFSVDKMVIHYENNSPFLTVTRLERLIEVSHWGNIAIEENIQILHTGAKLKGSFSRYEYQKDANTNQHVVSSYKTFLPGDAHSIYYRDSNGNISTSQVRKRNYWIELQLRPRFPLFGGWRSSYTLGYSLPSYDYLFKTSASEYTLKMRLMDHVFDDMHVEELETTVVLPVGVSNVKVKTPYEVERLGDSVTYKYLDTIGRKVIRLRKTNLVEHEQHLQDFEISYTWQPLLLLHEPILLSAALYLLFIVVIIYVRLDFSIHKQEKKE